MKKYLTFLCLLCGMALLIWIYSSWHHSANQSGSSLANSSLSGNTGKATGTTGGVIPPVRASAMQSDELFKYREARQTALHANHELENEYKDILQEMDDEQQKLDSAMLRADPKLEPIVVKLRTLGARQNVPFKAPKPSNTGKVSYVPAESLTPSDWQEITKARVAAIQSDPEIATNSKALAEKLIAFSEKLNQAVINSNPTMTLLITKLSKQRAVPTDLVNSAVAD